MFCCFCCHHRSILSHYFVPFFFFHKEKQPNIFLVRLSSIFEMEGGRLGQAGSDGHHPFCFKKRSCLLSTCNLIYFHSILPKYFLFCFVFIFANDHQFSCVDRWRPEETSLESRNKAFCDCSTLAWSPLSVARENGKAEEKSTCGTTDPPLLYLRALTFTRAKPGFCNKGSKRYEDVPNISPKMYPIECRSSQEITIFHKDF